MISGLTHEARRTGRERKEGKDGRRGDGKKEMEREGGKEEEGKKGEEKNCKVKWHRKTFQPH